MEVMETIVIQGAEVEGKDKAASVADTDKTKAGEFKRSGQLSSVLQYAGEAWRGRCSSWFKRQHGLIQF